MNQRDSASAKAEAKARPKPPGRRWRRLAWVGITLGLCAAAILLWLLHTASGRDFILRRTLATLPAHSALSWQDAQGTLAGPLILQGVQLALPVQRDSRCMPKPAAPCATSTLRLDVAQATLDPALLPLLARRLRLDTLTIRGARLDLPRDDTPLELPNWPDVLPTLDLPLTLQADALQIDDVRIARAGEAMIAIRQARGGMRVGDGRLHLEHLRVDSDLGSFSAHGDYAPRDHYRTDLVASAAFPAALGKPAPTLDLTIRGNLSKLEANAEGRLPDATRMQLTLAGNADAPRWQLLASSDGLDPDVFLGNRNAGTPLRFKLDASGNGGTGELRGTLTRDDFTATVHPSKLRIHDQRLELQPLVVDLLGGRVTGNGHIDFGNTDAASVDLALGARGLRWQGSGANAAVAADADLTLAGRLDRWTLRGQATLARSGEQARVELAGSGDRNGARIERLDAGTRAGSFKANGTLAWSPQLQWTADATLTDFNPGHFAPDWPGALRGTIHSEGRQQSNTLSARFDARDLGGQLRGRALSGHAQLAIDGEHYSGDLALSLGGSRIEAKGKIDTTLAIDASFTPLQLDDLLPNARGHVQGKLTLRGTPNAPDLTAVELTGSGIAWGDLRASRLSVNGRLPWDKGEGALQINASGLQAGTDIDTVHATLRGALSHLRLDAEARGSQGAIAVAGSANNQGARWSGQLSRLQLTQPQTGAWTLQAPADWAWDGRNINVTRACLQAAAGGALCANGGWPGPGLALEGRGLPLALASDFMPKRENGRPWVLVGSANLDAQLSAAGGWSLDAKLASASGGLRDRQRARRDLFGYRDLELALKANPQRLEASVTTALSGDGRLEATLQTGWSDNAALSATLRANTRALTWLELLSPDLAEPSGQLTMDLRVEGTRSHPGLGGSAQLRDFSAELPALGIGIDSGSVALEAREDGSAKINGVLSTGKGALTVAGTLGWQGEETPLHLAIRGNDVLLADTRQLRLLASPDLSVQWRAGTPVQVRGDVTIPEADIHLEKLDMGVSPSPDVVVLDPAKPISASAPITVDIDLGLRVGDKVRIDGYGLTGTLAGSLRVRQPPGREARATGTLDVGGHYRAYGQNLQIARGRMLWSNAEIGNPQLDIRAERRAGDVTAGIAVSGRAANPQARVYSDPAMSQSEAIAYLTLGRSLSTLNGREAQQVGMARSALNAGAGFLAAELGARIGLDDAGVGNSHALGGEVLGVGKYLSPRLYVGYGVSLLGTGQVVTLKYLLKKGFDIQIESSTLQNRASINWRIEK